MDACKVEFNIALFIKELVAYSVEPCKVEYCTVDVCRVDWTTSVFADIVEPVAVENNSAVADIDEPNRVEYCKVVAVIVVAASVFAVIVEPVAVENNNAVADTTLITVEVLSVVLLTTISPGATPKVIKFAAASIN